MRALVVIVVLAAALGVGARFAPDHTTGFARGTATITTGAFWMKNTLIPLDIAFYDGRGRILRVLTMQPCRVAACPLYDPKVAYRGALEVNAGSFRRWGVGRGDRVVVRAR